MRERERERRRPPRAVVLFLTDPRRVGMPLRLASRRKGQTTELERRAKRFKSEADAVAWLGTLPDGSRVRRFTATAGEL